MTPEEELELQALAELELEDSPTAPTAGFTPPDTFGNTLYSGVRDYVKPAADLAVDVGTGFIGGLTGPLGWAAQPAVAAGVNNSGDFLLREFGEIMGYEEDRPIMENLQSEISDAGTDFLMGGAAGAGLKLLGKGVKAAGTISGNIFDSSTARRKALFGSDELGSLADIADSDATGEILMRQGAFPATNAPNPFAVAEGNLSTIMDREAGTLAGLRTQVDSAMTPITQGDVILSPRAMQGYTDYNKANTLTTPEGRTFWNTVGEEATPRQLNMTGLTGMKAAYGRNADWADPQDAFKGELYKTMYQATKDKELELVGRYLTPDQQTQYRAALDLYERAAGVAPNIRALSSAAAKATSNIKPVGASVSNNRLGIFGSISGLFSDPSNRRLYEKAFTPQSTAGRFMGEQLPSMARNAASTIDSMAGTGGALFAEGYQSGQTPMDFKNSYQLGQQDGLLGNLTEPKQVSIPRNLNAIDAAAVEALLPAYVESYNAQPLAIQFKRLVAEGDKSRIADFLGQIATKYPDFPLQRGQVTGLSSEFDLGDGTARLASDIDKMEYERRVNVSDLSAVEKARRIKDVREKGMVHKLDMALVQSPAPRVSKSPSSPMGYQYSARVQTENGSRKVE